MASAKMEVDNATAAAEQAKLMTESQQANALA